MATSPAKKDALYAWEGKDKKGKLLKGEMRAVGDAYVKATLRRQGISVSKLKKSAVLLTRDRSAIKTSLYLPASSPP